MFKDLFYLTVPASWKHSDRFLRCSGPLDEEILSKWTSLNLSWIPLTYPGIQPCKPNSGIGCRLFLCFFKLCLQKKNDDKWSVSGTRCFQTAEVTPANQQIHCWIDSEDKVESDAVSLSRVSETLPAASMRTHQRSQLVTPLASGEKLLTEWIGQRWEQQRKCIILCQ